MLLKCLKDAEQHHINVKKQVDNETYLFAMEDDGRLHREHLRPLGVPKMTPLKKKKDLSRSRITVTHRVLPKGQWMIQRSEDHQSQVGGWNDI